jgi:hypothetical protein
MAYHRVCDNSNPTGATFGARTVYPSTLIASCDTNHFVSQSRYSKCSKKISAKNKRLLFSPKPKKFHTAEINGFTILNKNWGF